MSYESLSLDSIKMENPYSRLGTDVSTLEKSIDAIGLIAPLIVNQDNVLLAGARRWQALKNLGHETVPVIRVDKDSLQQELISIDENLVRKSLTNPEMESHLSRAKELYLKLAEEDDSFKKTIMQKRQKRFESEKPGHSEADYDDDIDVKDLVTSEFAKDVSEKSGLSSSQVLKAMEREEKSSHELKQARSAGQVSVSQANEVIRLDREDQAKILPHIEGRTVSELRKLVKMAKTDGVDEAVKNSEQLPHALEFRDIIKLLKKSVKISQSLELEGIMAQGQFKEDLEKLWPELKRNMEQLLGSGSDSLSGFVPEYQADSTDHGAGASFS